jgi:endonuclease/exonuclease/phosphatase family metal-dependent hydrolase
MSELEESRYKFTTILAGDLNEDVYSDKNGFFKLIEKNDFKDPAAEFDKTKEPTVQKENPYANMWFYTRPRSRRIDYIFFRNAAALKITPQSYQVLPHPPLPLSDHNPVMVSFSLGL